MSNTNFPYLLESYLSTEETRKEIFIKYDNEFSKLGKVMAITTSVIPLFNKDGSSELDRVMLLFFSGSYNTFLSIISTFENGFSVQASILARTLLEDFINIFYILRADSVPNANDNPLKLAKRFLDYPQCLPILYHERQKNVLGYEYEEADVTKWEGMRDNFYNTYIFIGKKGEWSGYSLEYRAEKGDVLEYYNLFYKSLSGLSHGNPVALVESLETKENLWEVHFGPSATDFKFVEPVCIMFTLILEALSKHFNLTEAEEQVEKLKEELNK